MRRITYLILVAACTLAVAQPSAAASQDGSQRPNPNQVLFPKESHPYGADMATWGERAAQWIYAQPLEHNPLLDQTGADCGVDQQGPVWFIPPIAGPPVFSGTRSCSVPRHTAILLDIGHDTNTYPCPDPKFRPAPGQSLYDFLIQTDLPIMDSVNLLEVSLDGRPFEDVLSYRFISDDLFLITGDTSLVQRVDPCITGSAQPAIVDGFFMMFKPLTTGQHTIRVHGTNTFGDDKTFTYHLRIA